MQILTYFYTYRRAKSYLNLAKIWLNLKIHEPYGWSGNQWRSRLRIKWPIDREQVAWVSLSDRERGPERCEWVVGCPTTHMAHVFSNWAKFQSDWNNFLSSVLSIIFISNSTYKNWIWCTVFDCRKEYNFKISARLEKLFSSEKCRPIKVN